MNKSKKIDSERWLKLTDKLLMVRNTQDELLRDAKRILKHKGAVAWSCPDFLILYKEYQDLRVHEEFLEYCLMYNYILEG